MNPISFQYQLFVLRIRVWQLGRRLDRLEANMQQIRKEVNTIE